MEKDFHYFLVYSIAKVCGFEDAKTIATASQFVDDNNEGQFTIDGKAEYFPEKIHAGGGYYFPKMTQSISPKSLNTMIQKYVYVPFHFIPGNKSVNINGETNAYSTTPNSPISQSLLKKALESNNPYQIGIALHSYADTWSHQNFTGFQEGWNSVFPWYNVFKSMVPNIGHAEALHSPDIISETWTDHRLKLTIKNSHRAFQATAEIYKIMRRKSGEGPFWKDVQKDYRTIINAKGYDERIALISDFLSERGLGNIPAYLKDDWIDAALDRKNGEVAMHQNFEQTDWYNFHQAAKVHFAHVMQLTQDL